MPHCPPMIATRILSFTAAPPIFYEIISVISIRRSLQPVAAHVLSSWLQCRDGLRLGSRYQQRRKLRRPAEKRRVGTVDTVRHDAQPARECHRGRKGKGAIPQAKDVTARQVRGPEAGQYYGVEQDTGRRRRKLGERPLHDLGG